MKQVLRNIGSAALLLDKAIEAFAVSSVALMTIIVTLQVITRKVFNFVFFWSEEVTLLLLLWFAFLGIAIGFREKLHLSMEAFTNLLPPKVNKIIDKVIGVSTLLFGIFLLVYGWRFTALMHANTMPATHWPSSVMFIIMPITGVLVCCYSILELCGLSIQRHQDLEEVAE